MPNVTQLRRDLKRKRRQEGLSLRALGTLLGISFSSLARIERGEGAPSLLSEQLLTAWLEGRDWRQIPRNVPRVPVALERVIMRIVDMRIRQWVDWVERDRRTRPWGGPAAPEEPGV